MMIARGSDNPQDAPGPLLSGGRNFTKARVYAVAWNGATAVVKSVSHQPLWLRWLAGRRWLEHEERAYRRLGGVPGVPRLLGRPEPDSLVCERIEGRRLDEHARGSLPPALFDSLAQVLDQAHARGVAHGDLHRRDVIVRADGTPWVLDWATSLTRDGRGGALRNALFRRWVEFDGRAIEKLRARYAAMEGPRPGRLEPAWAPHRWIWRLRRWSSGPVRNPLWGRLRLAALYAGASVLVAVARPSPGWMAAGLILMVPGEMVRGWAAGHLLKSRELVTSGPYAYTQNPLYLGRLLILTGLALMCRAPGGANWIALAIGMAGFFLYYLPRKLRVEGARLEGRHGDRFHRYREAVPILFPSLTRYPDAERRPWSWERMRRNREYLMVLGLSAVVAWLWSRIGH
jgi:protein-S-isoprenylcysteine O-methyltransferase Ste14/predicted Ser/Thr protein kinase